MRHLTFVIILAVYALPAFSIQCEDQSGWFSCPEYRTQPPTLLLRICSLSALNKKMLVTDYYSMNGHKPISFKLSEKGVKDSYGYIGRCDQYQNTKAMLFYKDGSDPALSGTYTFINKDNDLEAVVNNETRIICKRIK